MTEEPSTSKCQTCCTFAIFCLYFGRDPQIHITIFSEFKAFKYIPDYYNKILSWNSNSLTIADARDIQKKLLTLFCM